MCGILGLVGQRDEGRFDAALARLAHRGPDGDGVWRGEGVTLGHRRLAILDVSDRSRQPLEILDRFVITYNGEIYNFKELRADLEAEGVVFRSDGDTEALLHAFARWGPKCLDRLNGMWALGIWDKRDRTLFLARDRFGKKPLFYADTPAGFVFGSEMKAVCPFLPGVRPSEHFGWCAANLNAYESTDRCLIAGIRRFPAGHFATLRDGERADALRPQPFWSTLDHLEAVPKRYEEQVERFRELFVDACRLRMRSDVPIGTALSGGFDSSATISAMAHIGRTTRDNRVSERWQHAFVATFPGTYFDEREHAQKVIDHIGIGGTFLPIDPVKGFEQLEHLLYMFEELHTTSPIPMIETYKAVRAHGVTVTLDGHGADELLAGYGQDVFRAFRDCGLNLKQVRDILRTYRGMIDIDTDQIKRTRYDLGFYVRYLGGKRAWLRFAADRLLGRHARERPREGRFGAYNRRLYELFHETVLPTLLRNYDRFSMMNGVEIRMPFMDHRLVSFAFSLPWSSKLRGGFTKRVARDALAPYMPADITYRTAKIGFSTPVVDWMKGPWRSPLLDIVHDGEFERCDLIDAPDVRRRVVDIIERESVTSMEGERAWSGLLPFLWERAMLRRSWS